MVERSCGTCRYWESKAAADCKNPGGDCLRYPPVHIVTKRRQYATFPSVNHQHWCGEWKARKEDAGDETKGDL